MSFSPKNRRIASIISATSVFSWRNISSNSRSDCSPQCQVSSKASICAPASFAFRRLEQDVVSGFRVERRVEIDQVNTLSGEVAENVQAIPRNTTNFSYCYATSVS